MKDTFEDVDVDIEFNGERSLGLNVYVTTSPDVILTTDTVKARWREFIITRGRIAGILAGPLEVL